MKSLFSSRGAVVLLPLFLAACASLPPDGGRGAVATLMAARGHSLPDAQAEADIRALVAAKTAAPLTADQAVAIAYLQNPALRASYARLGIAAADVYDAGRLSNPRLSVEFLFGNALAGDELTFGLGQSFSDLLFLGKRSRVARAGYDSAAAATAQDILDVAADVQRAYVQFMAAQQMTRMRTKIADAARVGADLAARFHAAGNITRLELAIEQAAASDARLAALSAQAAADAARAELNRLMGFRSDGGWQVAAELQMPDNSEIAVEAVIDQARTQRLDLEARWRAITARAAALGLSKALRWGSGDLGVSHQREEGGSRRTGPALSLELPVFNSGKGRVARAAAELEQAAAELEAAEIAVANHIRREAANLATARARAAEYGTHLLPARAAIVARMQEEVNFMLRGPFDLLRARQQEYEASADYIDAVRDYWLARINLAQEAGGRLPELGSDETAPEPSVPQTDPHSHHDHMDHGGHP